MAEAFPASKEIFVGHGLHYNNLKGYDWRLVYLFLHRWDDRWMSFPVSITLTLEDIIPWAWVAGRMLQVDSAWVSRTVSQAHLPNLQQLVSTDWARRQESSGDWRLEGDNQRVWLSSATCGAEELRVHWPSLCASVAAVARIMNHWDFEWELWKLENFEYISSKTGHWSM